MLGSITITIADDYNLFKLSSSTTTTWSMLWAKDVSFGANMHESSTLEDRYYSHFIDEETETYMTYSS